MLRREHRLGALDVRNYAGLLAVFLRDILQVGGVT